MKPAELSKKALNASKAFQCRTNPELRYRLWSVEKLIPDHCPTCGKRFRDSFDHNFLSVYSKTKQRYPLPYKIAVCLRCEARTAVVLIESRKVGTKEEAHTLIREYGFTIAFWRFVGAKELKESFENPIKLHPFGIGLAASSVK